MKIIIQPSSNKLDSDILNLLVESISKEFVNSKVTINPLLKFDIHNFIPKQRNQLRSSDFLLWILEKLKPSKEIKILVICDWDAYSGDLNFVFGEAYKGGKVAAIYITRLRQEFYGLEPNKLVFHERIVKEAIHELGHICLMLWKYQKQMLWDILLDHYIAQQFTIMYRMIIRYH
jgi:archaemetzincin